jgi:DNA primase
VELQREHEDPRAEERRRRRERLLALTERAAAFYSRHLWEAPEGEGARRYLLGRGLGEDVLRDFRVGWSPRAPGTLLAAARRQGFELPELAAAGLSHRARGGALQDRFRGRIMFPLADPRGRVLGFGARALEEGQGPKYLNTSENELYHKGRQLFGIDQARAPAARAGRIVVVEGYTDVLALHQAGLPESVAIMGTSLTGEQLTELSRAAPLVYLALDADRAGQEAMLRAAHSAGERGVELRAVAMPEDEDPADLVAAEGVEAFRALLEGSLSVPEFEVRRVLADTDLNSTRERDLALQNIRPLLSDLPRNSATREELVSYVASRLDVPDSFVTTSAPPAQAVPARARPPRSVDAVAEAERTFLAMCLAQGPRGREYLRRIGPEHLSSAGLQRARDWLLEHADAPLEGLPGDDPELAALVGEVFMRADEASMDAAVLEVSYLRLELRRVERALRAAREAGDLDSERRLAARRQEVNAEMHRTWSEAE